MKKIAVIGTGRTGSVMSYEIAGRRIADEIVLIDKNKRIAEGHALDISHCSEFNARAGNFSDLQDSDIVVITAGKPRTPEIKTRTELARINARTIKEVSERLKGFSGVVIALINPLDIMNYLVWKYSGLPRERVLGSSSHLDSSRFRFVLRKMFSAQIEAFVIGEHGDSQVPLFSSVTVNREKKIFAGAEKNRIIEGLKISSLDVISKKGATVFAPAHCTADMVEAVCKDEKRIIPCSLVLQGEYGIRNVSIGVPAVLGKSGAEIVEWALDRDEKRMLEEGARKLRGYIDELDM